MSHTLKYVIVWLLFTIVLSANSDLYIPKEINEAIAGGTRTLEGIPGPNYWQNHADYKIDAEVVPDSSLLKGQVKIEYYNESPDTLSMVVIRLYQNISKSGSLHDWYIDPELFNDGVRVNEFKINGNKVEVVPKGRKVIITSTNMLVKLDDFLYPGNSISIEMSYNFKIPDVVKLRMGNYYDNDMFISYWYPQVAVYDDIDGWDKIEYSGSVEFYNDFNNYEFSISLPDNFVVWATGELMNGHEVFTEEILSRINEALNSDEVINIIATDDYEEGVTIKDSINTWKFKAQHVSDVSFCISDSYNWDAASVEVEPGRRVMTNAVYPDGVMEWDNAAFYSRETIKYFSGELPGYPYPYPHITSFCNKGRGGGMETPMMANNGAPEVKGRHVGLIAHEIAHSYFPFIMGTNERKYAWMDEGWASFLPNILVDRLAEGFNAYSLRVKSYESNAGKESELPPMVLSYSNKGKARTAFYDRPAVAYTELYHLLGAEAFKNALLDYIKSWHGKHPLPLDFFYSFNRSAGKDLSWFWKPWFYEFGYPDLAIDSVSQVKNRLRLKVRKKGSLPTRVLVVLEYQDGTSEQLERSCEVWSDGREELDVEYNTAKVIHRIVLGNSHIPDIDHRNNYYIFKRDNS